MTAEEFYAAKRVLEGGEAHSLYEIEDARAALAPIRRGFWRLFAVEMIVFFVVLTALELAFPRLSAFATGAVAAGLGMSLVYVPPIREAFIPARGVKAVDIMQVSAR